MATSRTCNDVEKLFLFIGATYNKLNKVLIDVVSKHALEDPRAGGTSDPNLALHAILSGNLTALRKIKSTSFKPNCEMLFTDSERTKFCTIVNFDISKMDCSLLLDLLLRFPDLMKTSSNAGFMCSHKTRTCCGKCDHSSLSCKKKNCSTKCQHDCRNCGMPKVECDDYAKICDGICKSCKKCNVKLFEQLIQQNHSIQICPRFMYHYCWEIMLDFRHLYAHSNAAKYQSFLDGITSIKLGDLFFRNIGNLKNFIRTIFDLLLKQITDPAQRTVPFLPDECKKLRQEIESIFKDDDSIFEYCCSNIEQIKEKVEALHGSLELTKLLDGMRVVNSGQTDEIFNKIDSSNKLQTDEMIEEVKRLQIEQAIRTEQNIKTSLNEVSTEIKVVGNAISKLLSSTDESMLPFEIHVSITRNDMEECKPIFKKEDLQAGGVIRKLFYRSITKAFEESAMLKHGEDYKTSDYFCGFADKESESSPVASSITFVMNIKSTHQFPKNFRDEMTEEVDKLLSHMKDQLEKAIKANNGMDVTVGFNRYKFGSIIIEGVVELRYGEFEDVDVANVLKVIREEMEKYHEYVTIELVPGNVTAHDIDVSTLMFSMRVSPLTTDVMKKIQDSTRKLELSFTNKLNSFNVAKAKDRKDTEKLRYQFIPPCQNFIGRDVEIEQIHSHLTRKDLTPCHLGVVLYGIIGIGKSEFARQYWVQYQHTYYEDVLWIDAESIDALSNAFLGIGEKIGLSVKRSDSLEAIQTISQKVYSYFAKRKVLFIFDNLENPSDIKSFLPDHDSSANILVTSQRTDCWSPNFTFIELKSFQPQIVKAFLEKNQVDANRKLLDMLDGHPIAMQQVVSCMKMQDFDADTYVHLLEDHCKKLVQTDFDTNLKPTAAAILLSLEILKEHSHSNGSINLLNVAAYLDGRKIASRLLLLFVNGDEDVLNQALDLLSAYSFIDIQNFKEEDIFEQKFITVHPLIQSVLKYDHNMENKAEQYIEQIIEIFFNDLCFVENSTSKGKYWLDHYVYLCENKSVNEEVLIKSFRIRDSLLQLFEAKGMLKKYLEIISSMECLFENRAAAHRASTEDEPRSKKTNKTPQGPDLNETSIKLHETQFTHANTLIKLGKYNEGLQKYKTVAEWRISNLRKDHISVLSIQHSIATTLSYLGKTEQALGMYKDLQQRQLSVLGKEHPDFLLTKRNIGLVLTDLGKYSKALDVFKEIETVQLKVLEKDDTQIYNTKINIASTLNDIGHFNEALEKYRYVKKQISFFKENHIMHFHVECGIAEVLKNMGCYKEALQIYKSLEKEQSTAFGWEHPNVLCTQHNIAAILCDLGKYKDAIDLFKRVEKSRLFVLGNEHPNTIGTQHEIAKTLFYLGKYKESFNMYKNLIKRELLVLRKSHPILLLTRYELANTLHALGEYKKAMEIYKQVEKTGLLIVRKEHPSLLTVKHSIAKLLSLTGNYNEALSMFKEIEEIQLSVLGSKHPSLLETRCSKAKTLSKIGKESSALAILENVEQLQSLALGTDHPSLLKTRYYQAQTLLSLGKHNKSLKLFESVEQVQSLVLGKNHPLLLETQSSKAKCLLFHERYEISLQMFKEVEKKQSLVLGKDHLSLLETKCGKAKALSRLGRHGEALVLLEYVESKQLLNLRKDHPLLLETQYEKAKVLSCIGKHRNALEIFENVEQAQFLSLGKDHPLFIETQCSKAEIISIIGKKNYEAPDETVEQTRSSARDDISFKQSGN